ncbi:hypothetical protein [Galbibacter pacificus]|uniref:hypothetical protein n=1 Tax=Galbibacter pacificus TaxID=2996052 RepID=UPI00241254D9|nr:hypothetical protein [Galbibacter pacificus]MDG3583638.1 hypothetical protein [Galbibacter pacificus]
MNFLYIKYLFQATNQHGVHSPFVYSLVTKALYKKQKTTEHSLLSEWKKEYSFSFRKQKIINKALNYFNDETYKVNHDNAFRSKKTIYFNLKEKNTREILEKANSYSFFIIDNIGASNALKNQWEAVRCAPIFSISIDFFNIGFLFVRKEQVKEDFKIRI